MTRDMVIASEAKQSRRIVSDVSVLPVIASEAKQSQTNTSNKETTCHTVRLNNKDKILGGFFYEKNQEFF